MNDATEGLQDLGRRRDPEQSSSVKLSLRTTSFAAHYLNLPMEDNMKTMRYLAGTAILGAVFAAGGCSTMMPMDHASMAKAGGCCGMCAMMRRSPRPREG